MMNKRIHSADDEEARLQAEIDAETERLSPKEPEKPKKEETFEKRYGDLRRHAQKREDELKAKNEELSRQLAQATNKQMEFPKSKDEVSAWATKYPDVYKMIVTIAKQNAIEVQSGLDQKVTDMASREYDFERKQAYTKLLELHPDFDTLKNEEDFIEWADQQPSWVYDALYNNDKDAFAASRAVDLYKHDRKPVDKPKTKKTDDDARSVRSGPSGAPAARPGDLKFHESDLARMSDRDYERNEAEINEAMKNPAFYDISGGAR